MSPDRLAELRRQRALVAQHLAWIDAELTAAGAGQPPPLAAPDLPATTDPTPRATTPAPSTVEEGDPAITLANTRADEIIEKYRATEALDPVAAKRGCLVFFAAGCALLGAVILTIYYFRYVRN